MSEKLELMPKRVFIQRTGKNPTDLRIVFDGSDCPETEYVRADIARPAQSEGDALEALEYAVNINGDLPTARKTISGTYIIKKHHIETIRQALQSPQVDWRPIETAPMDGTEFLAFCPQHRKRKWHVCRYDFWFRDEERVGRWANSQTTRVHPTHWMPLPPIDHIKQRIG